MHRKKASDFPQELLDLFDGYVHGGISRRQFLDRAQRFAVGSVTAAALVQMLKPELCRTDKSELAPRKSYWWQHRLEFFHPERPGRLSCGDDERHVKPGWRWVGTRLAVHKPPSPAAKRRTLRRCTPGRPAGQELPTDSRATVGHDRD